VKKKFFAFFLVVVILLGIISTEVFAFSPRTTAPDYQTYASGNPYPFLIGNCTWYAWARAREILGYTPSTFNGNAGAWYSNNINRGLFSYGQQPSVGAIACWDNWDNNTGHVAVVESVSENQIVVSESGYNNFYFQTRTINLNNIGGDLRFLGYIYVSPYKPLSPPTGAWISANKSLGAINESITFTCGSNGATGYTIGIDRDGTRVLTQSISTSFTTSFSTKGSYTAYITAWNGVGMVDSSTINFRIYDDSPINGWFSADKTFITVGETVTFKYGIENATYMHFHLDPIESYTNILGTT